MSFRKTSRQMKLRQCIIYFVVLVFTTLVRGQQNNFIDQCKYVCRDSSLLLPQEYDSQDSCQRGCRFLTIADLTGDHDISSTKGECYLSCEESYSDANERNSCNIGCIAMSTRKEREIPNIEVFAYAITLYNVSLNDEDLDDQDDILSDPAIRKQIQTGYNLDYKIPESKIRTMPIEAKLFLNKLGLNNNKKEENFFCTYWFEIVSISLVCASLVTITLATMWLIRREKKDNRNTESLAEWFSKERGAFLSHGFLRPKADDLRSLCSDQGDDIVFKISLPQMEIETATDGKNGVHT